MKLKQKRVVATQSECTGLAVVCGCFCFYSLLHLQNPFGELHMRSDSCMWHAQQLLCSSLTDWAEIHVQKPGAYNASPTGECVPQPSDRKSWALCESLHQDRIVIVPMLVLKNPDSVWEQIHITCSTCFDKRFKGALTLGNPYCAQARLTPKIQFVWQVWALCTVWAQYGALSWPWHGWKKVCSTSTEWMLMHEHSCSTWTWSIIIRITPPHMMKKSRNVSGPSMTKTIQISHKKVSKVSHVLCVSFHCAATALQYGDVCTRSNRDQSNAAQRGTGEEGQSCFGKATGPSVSAP